MAGLVFANFAAAAAVVLIFLFRKIFIEKVYPKVFVLLWMLVILRLLLPFEFSSGISLYSFEEEKQSAVPEIEIIFEEEKLPEKIPAENEKINSEKNNVQKAGISPEKILFSVWISGSVLTGCFFAAKHFYLVKKLSENCVPFEEVPEEFKTGNIRFYKNKKVASPLSYGVFKPVIILPEDISEKHLPFVLLHEHTHIKDRDSVLKILALFALALNWFNPFVWFMVKMLERDIELYCDERVLKKLGGKNAGSYANTILDFAEKESLSLSFFSAASLCERVTSIMKNKNKKQSLFSVALVFAAVVLVMTACGTSPKIPEKESVPAENISENAEDVKEDYLKIRDENAIKEAKNSSIQFVWPCSENIVTSPMGSKANHRGIDIGVYYGSEIFAAADGEVLIAEEYSEYGLCIAIGHEEYFSTLYANCSEIYVEKFDEVKAGDLIARTGSTGNSTCCGLHFELHKGKTDLNPEEFILAEVENLSKPAKKTETKKSADEIAEDIGYMSFEEITAAGYYPYWMQPGTYIIYDESGVPEITEGGELLPKDLVGRSEFSGEGVFFSPVGINDPSFMIRPNTKAEYDLHGFIQNIYFLWPDGNYNLSPYEYRNGYNFIWPCEEKTISASVGSYKGHKGIDIGSVRGSEIYAAANGIVKEVEFGNRGYGYYVVIEHESGHRSLYAHCSEIYVEKGQKVEAGETIALTGSTGNSTGPHLHFEILLGEVNIDPESLLPKP